MNKAKQQRVEAVLVPAVLLLVLLCCSHIAVVQGQLEGDDTPQTTLIVQYEDDAVQAAAAKTGVSTSSVQTAAADADTKARDRGASAARRDEIVSIAAAAAAVTPAVSSLTYSMYLDAMREGVEVTGVTNYATVLQGAAIRTNASESAAVLKEQLERNPKVKKVWYAGTRPLVMPVNKEGNALKTLKKGDEDDDETANPFSTSSFTPQSATDGNSVATQLAAVKSMDGDLDGTGQLVCVIDTGIAFVGNPSYGECKALNTPKGKCRVVTGYDFVGDAFTGLQTGPSAVRGGMPVDCMGHGTMVASVAGTSNGVAPGAAIGAYRVFGCSGYATDDILIEAIDRAVRDGCDIINLSLATGSGYADWSVFNTVMKNAISKGVIVVKAAGNSGRDGPFNADVATAAGAITLASVGSSVGDPVDKKVVMSRFSSIGPAPDLTLVPAVAAPGAYIQVKTMTNENTYVSGTSFSSPYTAGLLAMWLQHKQKQAMLANEKLDPATVSQHEALRGLVATAKGVKDPMRPTFLEPVARMGAGMIQAHAFMNNKARLDPIMIQLPSALHTAYTTNITLSWSGPPESRPVAYELLHAPSVSMTLQDGWYGTSAIKREYLAANVYFDRDIVVLDTSKTRGISFKVTFTLPSSLRKQPLLYSGLIELQPDDPTVPSLVVPYQGFSQPMSNLRVPARVEPDQDIVLSAQLEKLHNALCYAPGSKPKFINAILDAQAEVPAVCDGGFARKENSTLDVSLSILQGSPECTLRVTVVPELSLRALRPVLLNEDGEVIGTLGELDMSSGNSLATAGEVWSTCLHFNGSYTDARGKQQTVKVSRTYGLKVLMVGPLAAADVALGLEPPVSEVPIRGKFKVTQ